MGKQYKCSKCSKELANRHSLSRHKKMFCKERNSPDSVDQKDVLPSTASIIEKPTSKESSRQETSSAPSLRIWADPVKSTNPKISALVDAIVNEKEEEPAPKDDSITSNGSNDNDSEIESMDMTARQFDDDHESTTSKDSYSGIEPMDMTARQFDEDEDSTTSKDDSTASKDNLSPDELKDRLHRFFDEMKMFLS